MYILGLLSIYILVFLFLLIVCISIFTLIRTRLVPYVSSSTDIIEAFKNVLAMKEGQTFVELGCGNAEILSAITGHYKNIHARGYEIAPLAYYHAKRRQKKDADRYRVHFKSFMNDDLSDADVLYAYLLPHFMKPLWEKLTREAKKGTRLYSNAFFVPNIEPIETHTFPSGKGTRTLFVYEI